MLGRWLAKRKYMKAISVSRPVPAHLLGKWVHPEYHGDSWLRPLCVMLTYAAIERGCIPAYWDIREGDRTKEFCVKAGGNE